MSSQENIKGRLKLIPKLKEESLEDFAKRILNTELNTEWFDTYLEQLSETYKYIIANDNVYEIIEQCDLQDCDFCSIDTLGNGEFSFVTSFYNGGTYLNEVLQEELSKCKYVQ